MHPLRTLPDQAGWNALPRRSFLEALAASLLTARTLCSAAGEADGPILGFSLYGMKGLPLATALETCAQIGYRQVELALNPGYETEPSVFAPAARRVAAQKLVSHGLGVCSLMLNLSLTAEAKLHAQNLERIRAAAELARELAPGGPPVLETALGGKPALWEQQRAGMVGELRDWAVVAEEAKTVLALKAHVGSAVNSPGRLLWLLEQVPSPSLQVAYDYSHFELQQIGLEDSLRELLPRTRFIHVKDSEGDAAGFQFRLPGEGRTDYVKYFRLLRRLGYRGPVCVEVSGQIFNKPGYDPVAAARKSYTALSEALFQARQ